MLDMFVTKRPFRKYMNKIDSIVRLKRVGEEGTETKDILSL